MLAPLLTIGTSLSSSPGSAEIKLYGLVGHGQPDQVNKKAKNKPISDTRPW
jgi:hypothetical protein